MTEGIGYGPTQNYVPWKIVACGFLTKTLDKTKRMHANGKNVEMKGVVEVFSPKKI